MANVKFHKAVTTSSGQVKDMAELSEDAKAILEKLPKDGSMVGNASLMRSLNMTPERFFQAKSSLKAESMIVRGRGRGGSTGLSKLGIVSVKEAVAKVKVELSGDAKAILDKLPRDGSMVGNVSLMRSLDMPPDKFFPAKRELESQSLVIYGRGRGGSIGLAKPGTTPSEVRATGVKDEHELYAPLKKYFDDYWGMDYKPPDLYICKITGPPKGHKRKSGLWSRPDVSVLTVSGYDFIPERVLELTTVEAKRFSDIGTRAVFETVSQSKFGHQAYLAFEWLRDENMDDSSNEEVKEIFTEARRFGIGIIQMRRKGEEWNIDILLDANVQTPNPAYCNRFIEQNFAEFHKQIRGAIGR